MLKLGRTDTSLGQKPANKHGWGKPKPSVKCFLINSKGSGFWIAGPIIWARSHSPVWPIYPKSHNNGIYGFLVVF